MKTSLRNVSLIVMAAILAACGGEVEVEPVDLVRPVKLIELSETTNQQTLTSPAIIRASQSADLTFQVGGELTSFDVLEGQEVRRGQVIGRLDQRAYRNEVSQARTAFDSAQSEFDRAKRLIVANAISRSIYEQRETQLNVARAQLDTATKAIEDTVLRSPFNGVISVKHVARYQNVQPLEPIVTIQTTGAAEAEVDIPASLIAQSGRLNVTDTRVVLDSAPDVSIPASFLAISTQADPQTQTYKTTYAFTPPDDLVILPGMSGKVVVTALVADGDESATQIKVPLASILSEGEAQFVWVVDPASMTVSRREIEVGTSIGDELVVEGGLANGETIVGAGASYLHEGMQIRAYAG